MPATPRKLLWVGYQPTIGYKNPRPYPATNPLSKFDFNYGPNWRELDSNGILYPPGNPTTDGAYIANYQKGPVPGDTVFIGYARTDSSGPVNRYGGFGVGTTSSNPHAVAGTPVLFGGFSGHSSMENWGTWASVAAGNVYGPTGPISTGIYNHTNWQSALTDTVFNASNQGGGNPSGLTFNSALSAVYIGWHPWFYFYSTEDQKTAAKQSIGQNYPYPYVGGGVFPNSMTGVSAGSLGAEITSYIVSKMWVSGASANSLSNTWTQRGLVLKTPQIVINNPANTNPYAWSSDGRLPFDQWDYNNLWTIPANHETKIVFAPCVKPQSGTWVVGLTASWGGVTGSYTMNQGKPWTAINNLCVIGAGYSGDFGARTDATKTFVSPANTQLGNFDIRGGRWGKISAHNIAGAVNLKLPLFMDGYTEAGIRDRMDIWEVESNAPQLRIDTGINVGYTRYCKFSNNQYSTHIPSTSHEYFANLVNYNGRMTSRPFATGSGEIYSYYQIAKMGPVFSHYSYPPSLLQSIYGLTGVQGGYTANDGGVYVENMITLYGGSHSLSNSSLYQPSIFIGNAKTSTKGPYYTTRLPVIKVWNDIPNSSSNSWGPDWTPSSAAGTISNKQGDWMVKVCGALDADQIELRDCTFAIGNSNPPPSTFPDPSEPANMSDYLNQVKIKQVKLVGKSIMDFAYNPRHNVMTVGGLSGGSLLGGIICQADSALIRGSEKIQLITANLVQGGLYTFRTADGKSGGTYLGKDGSDIAWNNQTTQALESNPYRPPYRGDDEPIDAELQ